MYALQRSQEAKGCHENHQQKVSQETETEDPATQIPVSRHLFSYLWQATAQIPKER